MGSAYPAARLCGHFLKIKSLVFLNFGMFPETQMKLCLREPDFLKKRFYFQNWETCQKWARNRVLFIYLLYLTLVYWIFSCANLIFAKNCAPEIRAKILSANQIVVLLNQLFLWNKSMNCVQIHKNRKMTEKFFSGHSNKWVWPVL